MKKLLLFSMFVAGLQLVSQAQTRINATITVTQDPVLVADAGTDQTLMEDSVATLGGSSTASGGSGTYTYTWSPGANLDDSTLANPSYTMGTSSETISLMVVDSKNCEANDDVSITYNPGNVSINEFESASFFIYPNPVSNTLHIQGLDALKGLNASLTDLNGKVVAEQILEDGMNTMDVSSLSKGVYLLNVNSSSDSYQSKIVIE